MGKKGQWVVTGNEPDEICDLARHLTTRIRRRNLRYSQVLAARHVRGEEYGHELAGADPALRDRRRTTLPTSCSWPRAAARRTRALLFQETKALLNPKSLAAFLEQKLRSLGTAACPPYHLAIVIGGTERRAHAQDREAGVGALPRSPADERGNRRVRVSRCRVGSEGVEVARATGIGAQFGGKYFCHDARVIRLPRHGASCRSRSR